MSSPSTLRSWIDTIFVPFFYLGSFLIFCMGPVFVIPVLVTSKFLLSLSIILQSISPISFPPTFRRGKEMLVRLISLTQGYIERVLLIWLGVTHFIFVFPMSMFVVFVLLPVPVLALQFVGQWIVQPSIRTSVRAFRKLRSLAEVVVQMVRFTGRLARGSLSTVMQALLYPTMLLGVDSWFPVSRLPQNPLWHFANSPIADSTATRITNVQNHLARGLFWARGLVAVIVLASFHIDSIAITFVIQIVVYLMLPVYAPVILALWAIDVWRKAATEQDAQLFTGVQVANGRVYDSQQIMPYFSIASTDDIDKMSHLAALTRLITVLPGHGDQPIMCHLHIVDLAASSPGSILPYEAVSYVWGSMDFDEYINVNGLRFRVSSVLYQVLIYLRHPSVSRTLWIDALCINQANLPERSSQVLLMRRVYSAATRVVVWLGHCEPWGLKEMCASISKMDKGQREWSKHDALDGIGGPHYGAARVLATLLRQSWWTRMWVVQEFVVAQEIVIQCGRESLEWEIFCRFVDDAIRRPFFSEKGAYIDEFRFLSLHRRSRSTTNKAQNEILDSNLSVSRANMDEGLENEKNKHSTDILSLVYNFRSRKATDPRDKVFALLGLAEEQGGSSEKLHIHVPLVQPDYARTPSSLSIDFAISHIRQSRTLSMVMLAECARTSHFKDSKEDKDKDTPLPSWCPAFMDTKAVEEGLEWRPFWTGLPGVTTYPVRKCSATDNLLIPSSFLAGDDVAGDIEVVDSRLRIFTLPHLQNTIVATGAAASTSFNEVLNTAQGVVNMKSSTFLPSFQRWIGWETVLPGWWHLAEVEGSRQPASYEKPLSRLLFPSPSPSLSLEQSFHLTLTAGKFSSRADSLATITSTQKPSLPSISLLKGTLAPYISTAAGTSIPNPATLKSETKKDYLQEYLAAREAVCRGRRFFITNTGLLGIGPADSQVGDEVCVVLGSQVPMVLRQKVRDEKIDEDELSKYHYNYIGQAYVHPLMEYQGDLKLDIASGQVKAEEHWLC